MAHDDEVENNIPQYFVCPISLEIMKDPVTTITGITYERGSIEQWLLKAKHCVCPVTKQPLPRSSQYLTPNHTLRRLIQGWLTSANASKGNGGIQSHRDPLDKSFVQKLVRDVESPQRFQSALEKIHSLATESERNRTCMVEAGMAKAMVMLINNSFKEGNTNGLEEALRVLYLLWKNPSIPNMKPLVGRNLDFINSLTWILQLNVKLANEVMPLLKLTIEVTDSFPLGILSLQFFIEMVKVLRKRSLLARQAIKSALLILIEACSLSRNRTKIVEAGAVAELIELELAKPDQKSISELIFNLLAHLCSCAEGREQFLRHAAGIAVVTKRILRVSSATDDRAIHILLAIAKHSSHDVVQEMLRVGAVSKLCMVMQADCANYLKEKVRGILRLHSKVWNNSPCIQIYLLTRN